MQQVQISEAVLEKHDYSVWALPPEHVRVRVKKLMEGLRSESGGPHFEPHVTVIGAIRLTEAQARDLFKIACQKLKPYSAKVEKIDAGTFYYQCVYLLLKPTTEVTILICFWVCYWSILYYAIGNFQIPIFYFQESEFKKSCWYVELA